MRARLITIPLLAVAFVLASAGFGRGQEPAIEAVFARVDGVELAVDIYRPAAEGVFPSVIAVHGGSWHGGDKSNWAVAAPALAEAGMVVFAINYRLAPPGGKARYRDPLEDIDRAIDWVRRKGGAFGADASRIALLGSSAGGHLALLSARRQGRAIRGVGAWSPPTNLISLTRTGLRRPIRRFLGCSYFACSRRYRRMSPVMRVAARQAPTFLAVSSQELIPRRQVRTLRDRLRAVGVDVVHREIRGTAHGQGLRRVVLDDTITFLQESLARS